jgi:HEAT repeat protein
VTRLVGARVVVAGLAVGLIASLATGVVGADAPAAVPPGVARDGQTPLRTLAGRATAVVVARPGAPAEYDEGRLLVHPLRIEEVLRGRLDLAVAPLVEIRGTSRRPPLLGDAERVVVLLGPAAALSYLDANLPAGPRFEPVGGRDGVIPIRSESDLEATERLLDMGAAAAALPAGPEQRDALRALAFAAVGAHHPRWLADALLELRVLPQGAALTTDEVSALSGAIRDPAMPPPLRVRLLDLLGDRRWIGAADVVAVAEVDEPSVLDALLTARSRLGMPAGRDELAPHLASKDPRVRAAAVRALAAIDDPAAMRDLGHYATADPDPSVQEAAIGALGASGRDAAVPFVKQAFDGGAPRIRQASARALLALGGRRKSDALVDLALTGATPEARHYAALMLVISTPPDDPALRRLRTEATDDKVRHLLEHGIELQVDRHGNE